MATYIEGTNVPVSAIAGNIKGNAAYWSARLRAAENKNDVLFEMAYTTPFEGKTLLPGQDVWQGQGQGNPNVGAVQSDRWSIIGNHPSWATQAVQNPDGASDIYQTVSGPVAGPDYGQAATADDMARAGTNLSGQSHFFYGTNMPTTGFSAPDINSFNARLKAAIDAKDWQGANDAMFDIAWNMGKKYYAEPTDAQGGYGQGNKFVGQLQSNMFSLTDPTAPSWAEIFINSSNDQYPVRNPDGSLTGQTITLADKWVNPDSPTGSSATDFQSFRPWEGAYWTKSMPGQQGLLHMGAPPDDYSLSYLPGEFHDPTTWDKWRETHSGHIPEGRWVTNPSAWPKPGSMGLGTAGAMRFTAPGGGTNIAQTTWNAPNLSPTGAQAWKGILGLGDTPVVDTTTKTLLGV